MENTVEQKLEKLKAFQKSVKGKSDFIFFLAFVAMVVSPIIFIWGTFVLAIKIFFTGVWIATICLTVDFFMREGIKKVENELKQSEGKNV